MWSVGSLRVGRNGWSVRQYDIGAVDEVHGLTRKTPQKNAFSGVFVVPTGGLCNGQSAAGVLAETKGFEPLMQVYARMLP